MRIGGIILCGGKSSRMGFPKAWLPFGPELMLPRVVRILSEVVSPLAIVAAPGQDLPDLPHVPGGVHLVRDRDQGRGPLEGLRAGLSALSAECEAAYATSCDVPLLEREFVRLVISRFEQGDYQIAVPEAEGFKHPLAAVYCTSVVGHIEALLAQDRLRPLFLFEQVRTQMIPAAELRQVDPELQSLKNLNRAGDYLAALATAGFTAPPQVLAKLLEA
jgi:molybdopterin-guanine dinucleotide biosynthesis protein A